MGTGTRSVQGASAQRFAARTRRRRMRRAVVISILVLAVAVIGGIIWLVGWSSVLSVQKVSVTGVDDALTSEVAEAAEVPMGVPLAQVDKDEVADRVRELPQVGDVEIRRSWPRTITIDVEPRVAVAAVPDGGRWWSVDESGILFDRAEKAPDGVPVLNAPIEESATQARATGVAVLTSLPPSVAELVENVEVESVADVRLILADDAGVVRWGTADRGADKAAVLLELIERQEEPVSEYDVSAPDNPAVVP